MFLYFRTTLNILNGKNYEEKNFLEHNKVIETTAAAMIRKLWNDLGLMNNEDISFDEFMIWHTHDGEIPMDSE